MATPQAVANYILTISEPETGELISNLKLQKLLYYCQGFHLALTGIPLFEEEIEAWEHGPVVPSVYHTFKKHGATAIPVPDEFDGRLLTDEERDIITEVYSVYGQYSAFKLRNLTHGEPPWMTTITGRAISKEKMTEYFSKLVTR